MSMVITNNYGVNLYTESLCKYFSDIIIKVSLSALKFFSDEPVNREVENLKNVYIKKTKRLGDLLTMVAENNIPISNKALGDLKDILKSLEELQDTEHPVVNFSQTQMRKLEENYFNISKAFSMLIFQKALRIKEKERALKTDSELA